MISQILYNFSSASSVIPAKFMLAGALLLKAKRTLELSAAYRATSPPIRPPYDLLCISSAGRNVNRKLGSHDTL
jgi:hypothetical protein